MERKSRSSRTQDDGPVEEFGLWKQICTSLLKLEGIQKEEEAIINSINKVQLSVDTKQGITSLIYQKLKDNYKRGIELTTSEQKYV